MDFYNCSLVINYEFDFFSGELVESNKMLFQAFNSSVNGLFMSKLELCFLCLPWCLLELYIELIKRYF
jgi:hypothetical protein